MVKKYPEPCLLSQDAFVIIGCLSFARENLKFGVGSQMDCRNAEKSLDYIQMKSSWPGWSRLLENLLPLILLISTVSRLLSGRKTI